ncbi:MAG: hypothetical protein LBS74_00865 [Oscillospiraceae bacterium]|nr:hypothetical protein [Oscillospiraceae bacterium]
MFEMLLQTISAALVEKIALEEKLEEDQAMERLYTSKLYAELETEKTKVWHYSVPLLYELWQQEAATGKLILPEY